MGTPHIGMGRDVSIFQIGESPYRYGVHSNLGTNTYVYVNPHMCIISLCVRGTPHMQFFLDPRRFAHGDFPYAYRDQFLMCQRSFLKSRVESEFLHASQRIRILRMHNMRRASNINSHSIIYCLITPRLRSHMQNHLPSGIWNWKISL
jgi:hypothetical protein